MKPVEETATPAPRRRVHSRSMELKIKRNATYADLEATPEGINGQLIDGDLYMTTRPSSHHGVAITQLSAELITATRDRKSGWIIQYEAEVKYGKHVLIGDLVGWRRERVPPFKRGERIQTIPDFVCEALSPSTARIDRGRKREIYAEHKVGHLWFIDPIHQTLEVLALQKRGYNVVAMAGGSDRGKLPPFEQIELDLSLLWDP